MNTHSHLPPVSIGPDQTKHLPLGIGGSFYGLDRQRGEADVWAALEAALESGITHFDTATDYAGGSSERLLGRFMAAEPGRRERIFVASKANLDDISAKAVLRAIEASCQRLQTDRIDLYYLHWPRTGKDMRPWMEGLEIARQGGMIGAIGVSNFSVPQMEQLCEVGRIDACQIGYNLLWRFPERDVLPYCTEHKVAVVAYSSLAHGILAGHYQRVLAFAPDDQRWTISLFRPGVWPQVYEIVEAFKRAAQQSGQPLATLALRWLLSRPAVTSVLVSAKTAEQARDNVRMLVAEVPSDLLDKLTTLSERASQKVPDEGNPFGYFP